MTDLTDPRFPGHGNYLDWLMHLDPLELSAQNIDQIIAYNRKALANYEAGVKPKKGEGPKIDLVALGAIPKAKPISKTRKFT